MLLSIPDSIINEAVQFFSLTFVKEGEKLLLQSKVSISFKKGSVENFFVASGIVKAERTFDCKISYKARLKDTPEGPLASNCDCFYWSKEKHCAHTAAIYLSFQLEQYLILNPNDHVDRDALGLNDKDLSPPLLARGLGVTPEEYGTIISAAHKLVGAGSSATYSTLYYLLHNKKVVHFPVPQDFKDILVINVLCGPYDSNGQERELYSSVRQIHFSLNQNSKTLSFISIFETLYIFNWENGEAYHIPRELRELLQSLKNNFYLLELNDIIHLYTNHCINTEKRNCLLLINGKEFDLFPHRDTHLRMTIHPNEEGKPLRCEMNFCSRVDENEILSPVPDFLKVFTFTNGLLDGLRKKKEAYDFLSQFYDGLLLENDDYKKILSNSSSKYRTLQILSQTLAMSHSYSFDTFDEVVYRHDNHFLKELFIHFYKCFGELGLRFSQYNQLERNVIFQMDARTLLQGITNFHNLLSPYGVQIYYDRKQIKFWTSRVKFERRPSTTKWFDLQLDIEQEDLNFIRDVDINTGIAMTNEGLVLIDPNQKDLVKFIKKYVQYEANEIPNDIETKTNEISGNEILQKPKTKKFSLPLQRTRIFELFELKKMGYDNILTPEELQLCQRLTSLESIPHYPIPENFSGVLRGYQVTGLNWLSFLYEAKLGACLADDMGLGKTIQAVAFLQSIYQKINKVLIICPVTILINWEKEIKRFTTMEVEIYHGGQRKINDKAKIILTSYGVMKREFNNTLANMQFDILILDEVQHLKNMRSLGSFAVRNLKCDFRLCLTGTPVENDLSEFYNILDLAVPGIWGELQVVRLISNSETRPIARKTAAPYILRRTKGQVLTELPPKVENTITLTFSDEERKIYQQRLISIRTRIENATAQKKYGEILKGLLELRQSCLWQEKKDHNNGLSHYESTKINFLVEQLESILKEGHQAIVFSQFTTYLDIIQEVLLKKHWPLSRIDGSQSIKKRQEQVDLFQEHKASIFLISLKAGGVGLNLTAASFVFIMDPWWNPAVESQAIDRAHRIGQKNKLTVYRPVIQNTVEEKVLELQELKKQLFLDLLPENDDQFFTGKLSMKDFEHLFL